MQGVLTQDELTACIQKARDQAVSVEHLLMADSHIRQAQIGPALARFFGVACKPFNAARIWSELLHGALKRDFVESQGWMPLEESPDGLLIMCLDQESVRTARAVSQVYPRTTKFAYCVTTQTEFEETLAQLFGISGSGNHSIDQMLADMDSPAEHDSRDDSAIESAAADNELVKFVNKVIIDAHNLKASDIHIKPMPGNAKTGIRFRIDGCEWLSVSAVFWLLNAVLIPLRRSIT